jgi:cytochrome c oxidase assembly protein subunit 15
VDIAYKKRIVAYWLLLGVFMIIIQILLGGITRLTGSGLSITEWKPIMGAIPPLSEQAWREAFTKYQGIAQFKYENAHFTLSDFKFIFFWEWFHRLWARSLGVVFAIPFLYFLVKKYFQKDMIGPLVLLFVLGGLQGLIGWIMVQSGLNGSELLRVSPVRLAIHFISALILLVYTLWFALKLMIPEDQVLVHRSVRQYFLWTIVLLGVQLIYGAFMAGLRAATVAPTWPTINGDWIPANMFAHSWVSHPINVHFIHRGLAYILFMVILFAFLKGWKLAKEVSSTFLRRAIIWPLILVSCQVLLGILTVISGPKIIPGQFGVYEILAQSHQLVGMSLLMSLVVVLFIVSGRRKGQKL